MKYSEYKDSWGGDAYWHEWLLDAAHNWAYMQLEAAGDKFNKMKQAINYLRRQHDKQAKD